MISVLFLQTRMGVGGAESVWKRLLKELDRQRFQPVLCCLYDRGEIGEELQTSGIPVYSNLAKNRWDPAVFPRLVQILRSHRIDILYTLDQPLTQFWGMLAALWNRKVLFVTSSHSTGSINRAGRRRWLNLVSARIARRVVALSRTHGTYLEKNGIPASKIEIISNGVCLKKFAGENNAVDRAEFGIGPEDPVVGLVAMLRPEKAIEIFLDAAGRVLEKFPGVEFLIAGDGPEREKLERLAREKKITDRVRFLGLRPDIPRVVSLFDVAVLCSSPVVETLSMAALEYMAAGKPVVATRVGSLPELIGEGREGYLVEPGDSAGMAARIVQLIADPRRAREMGRRGQQRVAEFYTADTMVKKTEMLFERLMRKGS